MSMFDGRFFLTGNFNHWRPDDPQYRFSEVINDREEPDASIKTGSFVLKCDMDIGTLHFKLVENGDWANQWSIPPTSKDSIPLVYL